MQISKHFQDHEIAPKEVIGSSMDPRWFISQWQIDVAEFFRKRFGATIINDYGFGGGVYAEGITYRYSGTRPPFDVTPQGNEVPGASWSQHKFKYALDFKFFNATPDEVRDDIMKNQNKYLKKGVTTIESGDIADTWVHVDGRIWTLEQQNEIKIVGK